MKNTPGGGTSKRPLKTVAPTWAWRARAAGVRRTVGRAEPCLLGLYSVVALLYWLLPAAEQEQGAVDWEGKATVTFSDAITAVRRWLWTRWVFPRVGHADTFAKLPEAFQQLLLYGSGARCLSKIWRYRLYESLQKYSLERSEEMTNLPKTQGTFSISSEALNVLGTFPENPGALL